MGQPGDQLVHAKVITGARQGRHLAFLAEWQDLPLRAGDLLLVKLDDGPADFVAECLERQGSGGLWCIQHQRCQGTWDGLDSGLHPGCLSLSSPGFPSTGANAALKLSVY
ncbi:hypothetical protein D3C80_1683320 [compost metagenome]